MREDVGPVLKISVDLCAFSENLCDPSGSSVKHRTSLG